MKSRRMAAIIVKAVLSDLSDRKGCNISDIVDDDNIMTDLIVDLTTMVHTMLSSLDPEKKERE